MNIPHVRNRRRAGFSLIEMIGVLAIIAILAAVILPKVFATIASSRVTNTVSSINTLRTAVTEFVGKFGVPPLTGGTSRLDDLLIAAGTLEKRFIVKLGNQATPPAGGAWTRTNGVWAAAGGNAQTNMTRVVTVNANVAANPATGGGANFRLDGTNNLAAGAIVMSAIIENMPVADARELSLQIDGEAGTPANTTTADNAGKVSYNPNGANTDVFVYLAHQ